MPATLEPRISDDPNDVLHACVMGVAVHAATDVRIYAAVDAWDHQQIIDRFKLNDNRVWTALEWCNIGLIAEGDLLKPEGWALAFAPRHYAAEFGSRSASQMIDFDGKPKERHPGAVANARALARRINPSATARGVFCRPYGHAHVAKYGNTPEAHKLRAEFRRFGASQQKKGKKGWWECPDKDKGQRYLDALKRTADEYNALYMTGAPEWWTERMTRTAVRELASVQRARWEGRKFSTISAPPPRPDLMLNSLERLPPNVTLEAHCIYLAGVEHIPRDVTLRATDTISLTNVRSVGPRVTIDAGERGIHWIAPGKERASWYSVARFLGFMEKIRANT